jgi:hypothetical protein
MKRRVARQQRQKTFARAYGDMIQLIESLPVYVLLKLGRRVASSDYAVRFYRNRQHPKFHLNRPKLRKALRRAWGEGAFEHREQMMVIVEEYLAQLKTS